MIKDQYFLKDKKADIYRKTSEGGTDPDGYPLPEQWRPISPAPLWCYAKQLSQDQLFQSHWIGQEETRFFVFNNYPGIDVYDLVLYRDEWYQITRVDTKDDYKGDLFVYVKLAIGGWRPSPSEIFPYKAPKTGQTGK